jgi:hypothetical protein
VIPSQSSMPMPTRFSIGLFVAFLTCTGCARERGPAGGVRVVGAGNVVTIQRSSSDFYGVRIAGLGQLQVTQGEQAAIELTADDNLVAHLESDVRDGVLHLGPRAGVRIDTSAGIRWRVVVPRLEFLRTDGLIRVEATEIVGSRLHLDLAGSSTVTVTGSVTRLQIEADGVVILDGRGMETGECVLDCDGVFSMAVHAHQWLRGRACGTGTVQLYGDAGIDVERCPLVTIRRR